MYYQTHSSKEPDEDYFGLMKIELISYSSWESNDERDFKSSIMREVLIKSSSDIVVFPGSSILSLDDFMSIVSNASITIKAKIVVFEVFPIKKIQKEKKVKIEKPEFSGQSYCYDIMHRRFLLEAFRQWYATGSHLDRYPCLFDAMHDEWKDGLRSFNYGGKTFTILMCGETAMLKCNVVGGIIGPAHFRISAPQAYARYKEIMDGTDVFLNPIHTIQGNQGKLKKRRDVLSSEDRVYFSTASFRKGKVSDNSASVQYAVCNGCDLQPIHEETRKTDQYISRVFEI